MLLAVMFYNTNILLTQTVTHLQRNIKLASTVSETDKLRPTDIPIWLGMFGIKHLAPIV